MTDGEPDDGLEALRQAIAACRICRDAPIRGIDDRLPHEPRPVAVLSTRARVLIAGQAPGLRVHESGLPFDDASGDRLRQWLQVDRPAFYDRDRFAIVPMGFCFPGYDAKGSDLPPRRECAPAWHERLFAAMPEIELILAVGSYAQRWHMRNARENSMTATVARWQEQLHADTRPRLVALPHPSWRNNAWLIANPWFEDLMLPALRAEVRRLL